MKKLKLLLTACAVFGVSIAYAQTPAPFLKEKNSFGGTAVSQLSTFVPGTGTTYTLELTGCVAEQEITVPGGSFSYTPTTNGTVRFVRNGGDVVYVYEGTTYKGTVDVSAPAAPTYPTGLTSGSSENLIQNGGFEDISAGLISGKTDQWKPTCWNYYNGSKEVPGASSGVSVRNSGTIVGSYSMMMHDNGIYLTQQLRSGYLKNFTPYQISFQYKANNKDQVGQKYKFQVGSEEFQTDYYNTSNETNASTKDVQTFTKTFITPANIVNQPYIQIYRSVNGSGSQHLDKVDEFILVAANGGGIGITGATGASFLSGSAFAPEGAFGAATSYSLASTYVTSLVTNGTFDSNKNGWGSTTGATNNNIASNQTGAFTGSFYQNWNSSAFTGKMYQLVNDIPNGTYKLNICAFVETVDADKGQYVYANGNKSYVFTTTPTAYTVYTYVDDHTLEYGLEQSTAVTRWMGIDNVSLEYCGSSDVTTAGFKAIYDATTNHLADDDYENVTGNEKTNLQTAVNATPTATADGYATATFNIGYADYVFMAAKTNYDKYAAEAENADKLGVDPIPALDVASNYFDKLKALIVLEDAAVTAGYTEDATGVVDAWDVSNGELKTWTEQNAETGTTEHWSGTTHSYYDKNSSSGFTMSAKKSVSLPVGSYVLKAAARCDKVNGNDDFYLGVTVDGEDPVKEIYTSTVGNSGLGIDKTGAANYTEADDTYANSNNGFGWEWRFVPFTLTETKDVELKITANILATGWVSFSDIQLLTTSDNTAVFAQIYNNAKTSAESARDHANYRNVKGDERQGLVAAIGTSATASISGYTSQKTALDGAITTFVGAKTNYNSLATAIDNANTIVTNSINVGDGAFQVPTSIQTTLATAKADATTTWNAVETTSTDAATAATTLNAAIFTYNSDFATATLNEPADGAVFNVMITTNDSYGFKNKPLTFNSDNVSGAKFYKAYGVTPYRAQQITFTKVSGNQYSLSMINADGDRVYIRTNAPAKGGNGNTSQIRLTTEAANALAIQVIPSTTTNGVYTLKNTEANALLGCQDADSNPSGGLYTVGAHNNFTITSASKPSVPITISSDVKYATRIFPFTPTLPSGVKAYSCAETSGNTLTLVEEATPAANTPYILYAESGYTGDALTGWGTASADSYETGLLTGVYTDTEAPNDSYVLANIDDKVSFYQVDNSNKPTVGANRCYLKAPAGARVLNFPDNMETGIDAINALTSGEAEIYNAAGARVPALQKGLNIIKIRNGSTRKVIVK